MRPAFMPAMALATLFVGACVEPGQYGGPIAVEQTNVQARLRAACGIRGPSTVCEALMDPEEEKGDDDAR